MAAIPDLAGLILAGGTGERLGQCDKGLLMLHGEPFVAHVARCLRTQVRLLAISANRCEDQYRAWADAVLPDTRFRAQGPLSGLYEGLCWAHGQGFPGLLVAPCDAPRVPAAWAERIATQASKAPEIPHLTRLASGLQPLHGYFPVSCRTRIEKALANDERRVQQLVKQLGAQWCDCEDLAGDFLNINRPEDLGQLRS